MMPTYLALECLKKRQTRMTRDLAYESTLLVEVHPLQVRLVAGKDLVGLGYDPNLEGASVRALVWL